jgi:hypothetical protein
MVMPSYAKVAIADQISLQRGVNLAPNITQRKQFPQTLQTGQKTILRNIHRIIIMEVIQYGAFL